MIIESQTYELVIAQLEELKYSGPVCLSCDDTVLLPAWRLYWDTVKQSHFLVGGVGGPTQVLDPDEMDQIIRKKTVSQATKVRNQLSFTVKHFVNKNF